MSILFAPTSRILLQLMRNDVVQVARYILGLSWIYQGFFPKLLTVAPLEKALTATMGFSDNMSLLVTRAAGILEIVFGIALIVFYKTRVLPMLSFVALFFLFIFVALQLPSLLTEAFNPVTTNFSLMALSYVLFVNARA